MAQLRTISDFIRPPEIGQALLLVAQPKINKPHSLKRCLCRQKTGAAIDLNIFVLDTRGKYLRDDERRWQS